jgi:tRNA uridine 5-carboxymethylaminomethyl modification enzyme
MLGFPNVKMEDFYGPLPELKEIDPAVQEKIAVEGVYSVYLRRQDVEVMAFMRDESMELPVDLDYST